MTLKVLLVDPSIFTAPYDAALSKGLQDVGVQPTWAARRLRADEEEELPLRDVLPLFYDWTDGPRRGSGPLWKVAKGLEHAWDLRRLYRTATRGDFDVVHFQWISLPFLDGPAMRRLRRRKPVVLTVHDTTPHNGAAVSRLQTRGYEQVFGAADQIIVHTDGARENLINRGVEPERVNVVAHGPLSPRVLPRSAEKNPGGLWRVVMFGRVQTYKGLDVLVEAIGRLPPEQRARIQIIVAGEAQIPMEGIHARAKALQLEAPLLEFRLWRHTEQEMADLLAEADCFVFPYLAIESSGVLFLTANLGKWMIASALGSFVDFVSRDQGRLVPPGDVDSLAAALVEGVGRKPANSKIRQAPSWSAIADATVEVYRRAIAERRPSA